ncbi:MAG: hypothetical protein ACLRZ2_04055 [Veillonella sp.]
MGNSDPAHSLVANIDTKGHKNTVPLKSWRLILLNTKLLYICKVESASDYAFKSEAQYGPGNYIPDVLVFSGHSIMVALAPYVISCLSAGIKC